MNQEAELERSTDIAQSLDKAIGNTLIFNQADKAGEILDLRQHISDLRLYLILDVLSCFNEAFTYTVPLQDVMAVNENRVVVPNASGMHIRGFTYYEEEFTAIENYFTAGKSRSNF